MNDIVERLKDAENATHALFNYIFQDARAEIERLRAKVEEMEQQKPVAWMDRHGTLYNSVSHVRTSDKPLYALPGAQTAPSVPECPYPCGWRNLLKYAIEDGAYLARSINEDDPVTENARAVTMRMVMRLRDVLMAVNNAAPEAKP